MALCIYVCIPLVWFYVFRSYVRSLLMCFVFISLGLFAFRYLVCSLLCSSVIYLYRSFLLL